MSPLRSSRHLRLVRWLSARYARRPGVRVARALSVAIAVFEAVILVLLSLGSAHADPWDRTAGALGVASLTAAVVGSFSLAADLRASDERDGIALLARLSGFTAREIAWARVAATAGLLGWLVLVPGLAATVLGLTLVRAPGELVGFFGALGFALSYSLMFALTLGALVRSAAAIAPEAGRSALLGLLLVSELLHLLWPALPTPLRSLSWLLEFVPHSATMLT
jgi:hypothetical protein